MGRRKPWSKLFDDDDQRYNSLSFPAQLLLSHLHRKVDHDGTIARLKLPTEPLHLGIRRALGVDPKYRKMLRGPTDELLAAGFIYIDGDLGKLANWRERQDWQRGRGPVPSPFVEPHNLETGEVYIDATGTVSAPTRHRLGTQTAPTRQENGRPVEPNPTGSLDPVAKNANVPSRSASRSSSPPVTGNKGARGEEGNPAGGDKGARADAPPHGKGSDGAKVLDFPTGEAIDTETGEVPDPADFKDPTPGETDDDSADLTPEEREDEFNTLPPETPNPEEATEGAAAFPEVKDANRIEEGATS